MERQAKGIKRTGKGNIELPQTYTCSMTKYEAAARKAASTFVKGVEFRVVEGNDYIPEGYVAGQTIVTDEDDLTIFNNLLESL